MSILHNVAHGLQRRVDESKDENIGAATKQSNSTVSGLVSTLVTNLIVFAVMVLIFMLLRRMQKRWYTPKTHVETIQEWRRNTINKIPGQEGFFSWIGGIRKTECVYSRFVRSCQENDMSLITIFLF